MEKWEKNHLSGQFSKGGTGTALVLSTGPGTGTHCSILESVRIFAITCSFLIRFELFKWLIKLGFKNNKTS